MSNDERRRTDYLRGQVSEIADLLAAASDGLSPTAFQGRMISSRSLATMAALKARSLLRYLDGEALATEDGR